MGAEWWVVVVEVDEEWVNLPQESVWWTVEETLVVLVYLEVGYGPQEEEVTEEVVQRLLVLSI